jgi:hypothetical protein
MFLDIRPFWIVAALSSGGLGLLVLLLRRNYADATAAALSYWGGCYLCFGAMFSLLLLGQGAGPFVF